MAPPTKNPWLEHVKAFRKKHPNMAYKDVLVAAKKTYKKVQSAPAGKKKAPAGKRKVVSTSEKNRRVRHAKCHLHGDLSQCDRRALEKKVRKGKGKNEHEALERKVVQNLRKLNDKELKDLANLIEKKNYFGVPKKEFMKVMTDLSQKASSGVY